MAIISEKVSTLVELHDRVYRRVNITRVLVLRSLTRRNLRKRLHNTDFTMVSSNCIGGRFYQELGFPYNTPFAGLFIFAPCYIKLLGNLDLYLKSDISFITKSKYDEMLPPEQRERHYPVGLLGGEIEIHFQHYHDETEAKTKWNRRIQRMNKDNIFVTFTDRDFCNEALLNQFDQMEFKHKVCFAAKKNPSVKSLVFIKEYQDEPYVGDLYTEYYNLEKHFDFVDWLNGGTGEKE